MIIDAHGHVGSWQQYGMFDDSDRMLRMMDLGNIDRSCLFQVFYGDARLGNDRTAEFVRRAPDRFTGFAFVTPHYPEECQDELARCREELGFPAIKIYPPYFDKPVTNDAWATIFEYANSHSMPIISHTWGGDAKCGPLLFVELAERYPRVNWILGHAGGGKAGRDEAVAAAQRSDNIFLEICSSFREIGSIEELVAGAGADRVLFGSDIPLIEPRLHVARVLLADIDEKAKKMVLGENVGRLLSL